jgi:hypothetical protein
LKPPCFSHLTIICQLQNTVAAEKCCTWNKENLEEKAKADGDTTAERPE